MHDTTRQKDTASLADVDERARAAVKVFRGMQAALSSYARAITRNPKVRVEVASGPPRTDGTVIYYRPPIALGDSTRHDRFLCGKRDEWGMQTCPACKVREEVLVNIYHEIDHIAFETFMETTDRAKRDAIDKAIKEWGGKYEVRIRTKITQAPPMVKSTYQGLAGLISPFLPHLFNSMEDARIELAMFEARRGTRKMFQADVLNLLRTGIPSPTGGEDRKQYSEMELNAQVTLAIYFDTVGYKGWQEYLHEKVVSDTADPVLQKQIARLRGAQSASDVYYTTFPMLAQLRELGYFLMPEDEEQDDSGESSDDDEQSDSSDQGGSSDDDSDSSGESPDQSPAEPSGEEDRSVDGERATSEDLERDEVNADDSEGSGLQGGGVPPLEDRGSSEADEGEDQEEPDSSQGDDQGEAEGSDLDADSDGVPEESDEQGPEGGPEQEPDSQGGGSSGGSEHADQTPDGEPDSDGDDLSSGGGQANQGVDYSADGQHSEQRDESEAGEGDGELDDGDSPRGDGDEPGEIPGDGSAGESMDSGQPGETDDREQDPEQGDDRSRLDSEHAQDDELIDSGADEGLGGVKVKEVDLPDYGTPEDLEYIFNQVHPELKPGDSVELHGGKNEQNAVNIAIEQGAYFEMPSRGVESITEHSRSTDNYGWADHKDIADADLTQKDLKKAGIICDIDIPESVLSEATLKTRRIFDDNKTANYQRNLRSGRVNAKVLGKRAWRDNDDRLFQKKRLPGKKDYAVQIMMDISSSNLGSNLALLKRSVFAQAELLSRVGVPFSITAHSCTGIGINRRSGYGLHLHHVKDWSDPWDSEHQSNVADLVGLGGNLDGHAMEYGRKQLGLVEATDKIFLYYTDGKFPAANKEEELEVLLHQLKLCQRDQILLLGVGIRTDSPSRFGLDTVQVDSDSDLQRVVEHLGKRLQRSAR